MDLSNEQGLPTKEKVKAVLGESIVGRVSELGEGLVLKEDLEASRLPRQPNESDQEYYSRRSEFCFIRIRRELKNEKEARSAIPEEANVLKPKEHHFIAAGSDGYPSPFRIQKRMQGKMLKDVPSEKLEEHRDDLDSLIKASVKNFLNNGHLLDLVGCIDGENKSVIKGIKKYLSPFQNSANIFLTDDNEIAIVDIKVVDRTSFRDAVMTFLSFVYYFRSKLSQRLSK